MKRASQFNVDPKKIVVVGDSAGILWMCAAQWHILVKHVKNLLCLNFEYNEWYFYLVFQPSVVGVSLRSRSFTWTQVGQAPFVGCDLGWLKPSVRESRRRSRVSQFNQREFAATISRNKEQRQQQVTATATEWPAQPSLWNTIVNCPKLSWQQSVFHDWEIIGIGGEAATHESPQSPPSKFQRHWNFASTGRPARPSRLVHCQFSPEQGPRHFPLLHLVRYQQVRRLLHLPCRRRPGR